LQSIKVAAIFQKALLLGYGFIILAEKASSFCKAYKTQPLFKKKESATIHSELENRIVSGYKM